MLSFMGAPVPPVPPFVVNPEAWSFFKLLDLDQRGDVEIEQFLMGCLRHGWVQTAGDVTQNSVYNRKKTWKEPRSCCFCCFSRCGCVSFWRALKFMLCWCHVGWCEMSLRSNLYAHTVDGRNPAPVDMVNIPLFTGFHTCQTCDRRISEPSNSRFSPQNREMPSCLQLAVGPPARLTVAQMMFPVIRRVSRGWWIFAPFGGFLSPT